LKYVEIEGIINSTLKLTYAYEKNIFTYLILKNILIIYFLIDYSY